MLTLFYAPGVCSLASHIALEEAGAAYEARRVDFKAREQRSADYLKINPKGRVPALLTDRGVLTESPVILGYVAQSFPDARLADNDDSFAFGNMQAFNMWLASHVHVAFAHVFRPERYADGEASAAAMRVKALETLKAAFADIEHRLSTGGPFVHGATYTVSDPYLLVFERWYANVDPASVDSFAAVRAHRERVSARPAVKRVFEAEGIA